MIDVRLSSLDHRGLSKAWTRSPINRLCIWWLTRQNFLIVRREKSRTETLAALVAELENQRKNERGRS